MIKFIKNGTVTNVKGFKAAGLHCGIKKKRKDLALIFSEELCVSAGAFTLNKVKAAPLIISQKIIKSKNKVRAVLINSGNANACTGEQGRADAIDAQKYCALKLGVKLNEVLISSTGVIGKRLNVDAIKGGVDKIIPILSKSGGIDAAEAILTTDTFKKTFAIRTKLSCGEITLGAICKGSGMIMPNMATMLAFICSDVEIEQTLLRNALSLAVKDSFNKISVDGETSTNDMVIALCNGASKVKIMGKNNDYSIFVNALSVLCKEMAKSIIHDGEGATKFITVNVINARTDKDADLVAKQICNSPLVKTAFYGEQPNWGRIISAAGNSGASFAPEKAIIKLNSLTILEKNFKTTFKEKEAQKVFGKKEVELEINLNAGKKSTTWWTCDYSTKYIDINANYLT